jgi:ATP-dependent phosphoenolpyruvate carboxykinase
MLSGTLGLDNRSFVYLMPTIHHSIRNAGSMNLTYLPETRVDVLRELHNWAGEHDDRSIFWLDGLAGTGKTTIARTSVSGMLLSAV